MLENIGVVQKLLSEAAKRRLRAGRMLLAGKSCAEASLAVGVARQTVYLVGPAKFIFHSIQPTTRLHQACKSGVLSSENCG